MDGRTDRDMTPIAKSRICVIDAHVTNTVHVSEKLGISVSNIA